MVWDLGATQQLLWSGMTKQLTKEEEKQHQIHTFD